MGILHVTMGILHVTMGILLTFCPPSYPHLISLNFYRADHSFVEAVSNPDLQSRKSLNPVNPASDTKTLRSQGICDII